MRLTKHHGLGNDFLVLLDLDGTQPVSPEVAVALCDRRTGLGADGLLRVTAGSAEADVTMQLLNADGSHAEMSGNGIRCVAQAVFQAGIVEPSVLRVVTVAGLRTVTLVAQDGPNQHRMSVEMGPAKVGGTDDYEVDGHLKTATRVDVGNPHAVIRWDGPELPGRDQLIAIGSRLDGSTPEGINVEIVQAGPGPDALTMVVYERGVGPTQACGSGACAVAAAAREWGIVGERSMVHMPGGAVEITLGDPVLLIGDTTSVAIIDTPWP